MRRAAGAVSVLLGLGFGLPCVLGLRHFARTGEVWTFVGFPTYGDGPFVRIGVATSGPLLAGFLTACIAEVAVGALLWVGVPHSQVASYVLLPIELAFWIGFALPVGPVLGLTRTALLVFS